MKAHHPSLGFGDRDTKNQATEEFSVNVVVVVYAIKFGNCFIFHSVGLYALLNGL